jgi:Putative polyhydroxyalkanoic acid system protein (PHA_gran_rgn)
MKDKLEISRQLPIPAAHMPNYAQYMAAQLQKELGITWSWVSPTSIDFKAESGVAKGAAGSLSFEGSKIFLMVKLPFMLAAMSPSIERTIEQRLDAVEQMAKGAQPTG